jgi:tetratricopeptide (TPR) repeat protein
LTDPQQIFDEAMRLFHARDFGAARALFARAAESANRSLAFAARSHLQMCEQRLEQRGPELRTPEDRYAYAVALTNLGRHGEAIRQLEEALAVQEADHYHYALSVAAGLSGNIESAARHLQRAIELSPANRNAARTDPDFAAFASHPLIQALIAQHRA